MYKRQAKGLLEDESEEDLAETEKTEEKSAEPEDDEDNGTLNISVEQSAALAFDAADLADILKKVNRAMESGEDA